MNIFQQDRTWPELRPSGRRFHRTKVYVGTGLSTALGILALLGGRLDDSSIEMFRSMALLFAVLGLARASGRALNVRAFRHADRGVPVKWTAPPLLGVQPDARMRRIEETIMACEPPMEADHEMALKAARARSEDLTAIALPFLLAGGLAIATLTLQAAEYGTLFGGFTLLPIVFGLFFLAVAWRYLLDGRRAQAFLKRYGSLDAASDISAE